MIFQHTYFAVEVYRVKCIQEPHFNLA